MNSLFMEIILQTGSEIVEDLTKKSLLLSTIMSRCFNVIMGAYSRNNNFGSQNYCQYNNVPGAWGSVVIKALRY